MSRRRRITGTLSLATLALVLVGGQPGWTSPTTGVAPAGPGAPDLDALLRRTIEQVKRDREAEEQFQASYAFTRMKVTETRDGSGRLTKRTEEQTANPRPASETPNPGDEAEPDHTDQSTAKRPYERRDFKVDAALLERFRFALAGTECIEGRATWVVDFEPASDRLPARSLKDRFINRTAGRLWIDQEEAALTRAEFRLTTPISVAGGLVGALKTCAAHLERQRTPDGLWYPRLVTWKIEGRKFFSTRRMEHRDEITDVRPLARISHQNSGVTPAPTTPCSRGGAAKLSDRRRDGLSGAKGQSEVAPDGATRRCSPPCDDQPDSGRQSIREIGAIRGLASFCGGPRIPQISRMRAGGDHLPDAVPAPCAFATWRLGVPLRQRSDGLQRDRPGAIA